MMQNSQSGLTRPEPTGFQTHHRSRFDNLVLPVDFSFLPAEATASLRRWRLVRLTTFTLLTPI